MALIKAFSNRLISWFISFFNFSPPYLLGLKYPIILSFFSVLCLSVILHLL